MASKKPQNPFKEHGLHHYELVYNDLGRTKPSKILDYGTGNAEFISHLKSISNNLYSFDVDKENVKKAKEKFPYIKCRYVKVGNELPYKENTFDAVVMFHVLEHVDSEKKSIKKVSKILKKNGIFYLASPYDGLFTWADTANLRYRFPRFHKKFMDFVLGEEEYKKRFIQKKEEGLFGDCTSTRTWHKHYKETEIRKLLEKDFEIEEFYKFSVFHPFLLVLANIWDFIFKRESKLIKKLVYWDNLINAKEFSYNFLVIARRK